MTKAKNSRKRLFSLLLALAMVLTSVAVPQTTAEAAKKVKVKKVQITSPKKKTVTLVRGKTLQIKVKVTPKNAKNKKVTYKSSKKKIASVTSKGKVKGLKKGTAKITVTAKDGSKKKATLTVKVVNPVKVKSVKLNKTSLSLNTGKSYTLKATISPKNATDKAVTWKTSSKSIATVTSKGVVKGVKAGTATITATAKDGSKKKASCKVTVKAASTPTPPGPNPPGPNPPAEKTLDSIEVTKAPTKTEYIAGEKLELAGMEVTAKYSDNTTKVLEASSYTASPAEGTVLTATRKSVSVSYKEGTITKRATTPITVKGVTAISIKTQPTKLTYEEGEKFDPAGMVVEAVLSDETTKEITDYTYPTGELAVTAGSQYSTIKIGYAVGSSQPLEADVEITVTAKNPLKSISVELLKTTLPREDGHFQEGDVKVTATFEDNSTKEIAVEDCAVEPDVFTKETTSATVTYWYGGISKSDEVSGFTVTTYSEKYTFEDADTIGTLVKRANEGSNDIPTADNAADIVPEFVPGLQGNALKMDGTYGVRLDKIAGTNSGSYSISMWVKPEAFKTSQALVISTSSEFGFNNNPDGQTWCAVADSNNDGKLKLWSYEPEKKWVTVSDSVVIEKDKWSHVVLVVDGTTTAAGTALEEGSMYSLGTLYVNGKKIGSGDVVNEKANGRGTKMKTYFGANAWSADGYFKGLVDEFTFTNAILTEDDVEAYYLENVEAAGNEIETITSVSPDDGEEIEVPYGTSLADVKRELLKIAYKGKATVESQDKEVELPTTSGMWTLDGYTVTKEGEVNATARIEAPNGYLFNLNGKKSVSVKRTVKVKIAEPTVISTVTPSVTSITVPYGQSEEEIIKALKEQVTFTAATTDGTPYTVTANAGAWKLTAKEAPASGYDAVFELKNPASEGYKYSDEIEVKVTVNFQEAVTITALTADKAEIEVVAGMEEEMVKSQLAALKFTATVEGDAQVPSFTNASTLWTITGYDKDTAATYPATAALTAPVGYKFADGVGTISVNVKVKAKTTEKNLDSIAIDPTSAHKTKVIVGHKFDKKGLVVKATYTNAVVEDVSAKVTVPDTVYNELGTQTVTVSYSEGEGDARIERSTSFSIEVVNLEQGAIGYYKFEGNLKNEITGVSGEEAVLSSKVKNPAAVAYSEESVLGEKALKVTGPDGKGIKLDTKITDTATYSISMWVKAVKLGDSDLKNQGHAPVLFMNGADGYQNTWFSNMESNPKNFAIRGANWDNRDGHESGNQTDVLVKDTWKMITLSVKDNAATFYVDGKEKFTMTMYHGTDGVLYLGTCPFDYTFNAEYDEVSIYDFDLSAKEVETLFGRMKPTIANVTTDKTQIEMLKADAGENNAGIQAELKKLNIQTKMKVGVAPEFTNDTDWTLTETATGYTATKKLSVPDGYVVQGNEKLKEITLTVNVIVKDIKLEAIAVKTAPSKEYYVPGETFDASGIEVLVTYDDGSAKEVGAEAVQATKGATAELPEGTTSDNVKQQVTISYTDGGITKETTLEITVINPSAYQSAIQSARTQYYTFDDRSLASAVGGKTATGATHSSLADATIADDAYVAGKKGVGLKTDGTGIKLADGITGSTFTINFWVKPTALDRTFATVIWGIKDEAGSRRIALLADALGVSDQIRLYDGSGEPDISGIFSVGTWTMITWVNDGTTLKIYKDGVEKYSGASTASEVNKLYVGAGRWDQPFQGTFDEVSVYNTALTLEQITSLRAEALVSE